MKSSLQMLQEELIENNTAMSSMTLRFVVKPYICFSFAKNVQRQQVLFSKYNELGKNYNNTVFNILSKTISVQLDSL